MTVRSLVPWPTGACDLDCRYCYRTLRRGMMSPAAALAALEVAAASGEPFHVQFAGGEPTLNQPVLTAICERIRQDRLPATVALQTNATRSPPSWAAPAST